jgi:hypothetical protein
MTFCHFDEFEDAVLSIELAAEKFSASQSSPTLWKWVIIAMQNALQGAMVLALSGSDGCGALYPKSQKQNREWLENLTPNRPPTQMADYNTLLAWIQRAEFLEGPSRWSPRKAIKTSDGLISYDDNLRITIRQAGESICSTC